MKNKILMFIAGILAILLVIVLNMLFTWLVASLVISAFEINHELTLLQVFTLYVCNIVFTRQTKGGK